MGEPVVLHNKKGETLSVYTPSQVQALLSGGHWFATVADAEAGKVRKEPTPATAARIEALDGGADSSADVTEAAPPARAKKDKAAK